MLYTFKAFLIAIAGTYAFAYLNKNEVNMRNLAKKVLGYSIIFNVLLGQILWTLSVNWAKAGYHESNPLVTKIIFMYVYYLITFILTFIYYKKERIEVE